MSKKWFNILVLSAVAFILNGCDLNPFHDDEDKYNESLSEIRPYQRVAIISGTKEDIKRISLAISDYIVYTNEEKELNFPSNWTIAGANPQENETYDRDYDLIHMPVDTGNGVYKSRIVELCNANYAKEAVASSQHYGSALPFEVSVHSDGKNVYVDMLDSKALFSLFFSNSKDKDSLKSMAKTINFEIRTMIFKALVEESVTESTKQLGPKFTQGELNRIQERNVYKIGKYQSTIDNNFTNQDVKQLAETIISTFGNSRSTADINVPSVSSGSSWRSARDNPIVLKNIYIIEAYSETYAKMVTKLGAEYLTALPCEVSVYLDDEDSTGGTIGISILNPNFVFDTMLKDAVENAVNTKKITKEEEKEYDNLASIVLSDLYKIVNTAIVDSGLSLKKVN